VILDGISNHLRCILVSPIPRQITGIAATIDAHVSIVVVVVNTPGWRAGPAAGGAERGLEVHADARSKTEAIGVWDFKQIRIGLLRQNRCDRRERTAKNQWFHTCGNKAQGNSMTR